MQRCDQVPLPLQSPPPFPPRTHVKPIVRWPGGKRWATELISNTAYVYLQKTRGRYVEPFLGGGAIALDLGLPGMILGDFSEPLIHTYLQVRKFPREVWHGVKVLADRGTDKDTYNKIRDERPHGHVGRAAWLLYLNVLCFNGVWRVNSQGVFNAPYGVRRKDATTAGIEGHAFRTVEHYEQFAAALRTANLARRDFRETLKLVKEGDLVYADPPYYGVYDAYTQERFTEQDQIDLAEGLRCAYDRGADIIATNSDAPQVREMYSWAAVQVTGERRQVNRDTSKRGPVDCLVITTIPDLLWPPT